MSLRCVFYALPLMLLSCKPSRPAGVISEAKFENILVDFHLAQGMSELSGSDVDAERYRYIQAVFRQYNVTEAQFDSSMVYYSQHSEKLSQIYQRVLPRIQASLNTAEGNTGIITNAYARLSAHGDTANIWKSNDFTTLVNTPTQNLFSFVTSADTSYHLGDSFLWHFHTQFVSADNMGEAVAQLVLRFANDSTVSTTSLLRGNSNFDLKFNTSPALDTVQLISVEGFVHMPVGADLSDARRTALLLTDISLVRMHKQKIQQISSVKVESVSVDSMSSDTAKFSRSTNDTHSARLPERPMSPSSAPPVPTSSSSSRRSSVNVSL